MPRRMSWRSYKRTHARAIIAHASPRGTLASHAVTRDIRCVLLGLVPQRFSALAEACRTSRASGGGAGRASLRQARGPAAINGSAMRSARRRVPVREGLLTWAGSTCHTAGRGFSRQHRHAFWKAHRVAWRSFCPSQRGCPSHKVAHPAGFEPATSASGGQRSIH
jgi:hypothetical protein